MNKWTRVKFQPNLPLKESGRVTASKEHIQLSKEAAKEGMVLLKNENHLLPLAEGTRIALFQGKLRLCKRRRRKRRRYGFLRPQPL